MTEPRASRDPVARRQIIIRAAIEAIAELGTGHATHRAIAARAGVPLGATTYYFPTLADLHAAALEQATDDSIAELDEWSQRLHAAPDFAATLAQLCREYVENRSLAITDYELYVAAARNVDLRPAARRWVDGCRELIAEFTDELTATAVVALIDGAILRAVVLDEPLEEAILTAAIRRVTAAEPLQ